MEPPSLPQELNEYERRRLDNIRRNDEMMAALKLHSKAASLLSSKRRPPRVTTKPEKRPKTETTPVVVIRRSLRTRGIPPPEPDSKGLEAKTLSISYSLRTRDIIINPPSSKGLEAGTPHSSPIPMSDAAYRGHHSDRSFIESFVAMAKKESPHHHVTGARAGGEGEFDGTKDGVVFEGRKRDQASFEVLQSMELDPKNIARVVPEKINVVRFIPSTSVKMIVAGSQFGNIGFWNVGDHDDDDDDEGRVYLYRPRSAFITGISVHPHCFSKIYTGCYYGSIQLLDAEKEIFDLVYSNNEYICSLHQPKNEVNSLYFGRGRGGLTVWDERMGKCRSHWVLHEDRINTIDFNPENPHIVATSSSDGTACIWDLRYADSDNITALKTLTHKRGVQSAYFSPSGCSLATTSMDKIGIYGGVNLEDATTICNSQAGKCSSTFRAIWGWGDSYLFGGNRKRGVDVVSAVQRKIVMTLKSPHMSASPCRFDVHPYEVGTLAGTTSGGQVYVWISR